MTAQEHDIELYWKALEVKGYDYAQLENLESLCLTKKGAESIRKIRTRLLHKEESEDELR